MAVHTFNPLATSSAWCDGCISCEAKKASQTASATDLTHHCLLHTCSGCCRQNEADIAAALRDVGIPRSSVFITSKVSPYQQGTAKATAACADILQRLDTPYVDLLLIHWPGVARLDAQSPDNAKLRLETWRVRGRQQMVDKCVTAQVAFVLRLMPAAVIMSCSASSGSNSLCPKVASSCCTC